MGKKGAFALCHQYFVLAFGSHLCKEFDYFHQQMAFRLVLDAKPISYTKSRSGLGLA